MLGLTFKENCADLRNSKVVDIIHELKSYGVEVFVHDPHGDAREALHEYGIALCAWERSAAGRRPRSPPSRTGSTRELGADEIAGKLVPGGCFVDVKAGFDAAALRAANVRLWRL